MTLLMELSQGLSGTWKEYELLGIIQVASVHHDRAVTIQDHCSSYHPSIPSYAIEEAYLSQRADRTLPHKRTGTRMRHLHQTGACIRVPEARPLRRENRNLLI
jgi:hypothetical protein